MVICQGGQQIELEGSIEISELLAEKDIALDVRAKDKLSVLSQIATHLADQTGLEEWTIREGFLARENAD